MGLSRDEVKKLLNLCFKEQPIVELMEIFGWKNRTKFKEKYIAPLIKQRWLKMTIPTKPNSPKQKYIITEEGKELLKSLEE
ncbi:MAG: Fic family protein [Promethearchaeota archaeon]